MQRVTKGLMKRLTPGVTPDLSVESVLAAIVTRWFGFYCLSAIALAVVLLQPGARAQGVQQGAQAIYTDPPQNTDAPKDGTGPQKNGWVPFGWATINYANTAPVHSGAASISVSAGPNQALYLHHQPFNTRLYTALTFWIHGGPSGGQALRVQATHYGTPQAIVPLDPLPANAWRQVSIPLSQLGVAGNADSSQNVMDGFWIQDASGQGAATFYVDDITLVEAALPAAVNLSVDAGHSLRSVDDRFFGVNTATWDSQLAAPATPTLPVASTFLGNDADAGADYRALRFPGGSTADDFHWQAASTGTSFDQFAAVAQNLHAQVVLTANYGSGTAQEAADWVTYANTTKGYGFRYWEIGNEEYGKWETDTHGPAPDHPDDKPHDPATYARYAADYMNKMRAADSSIKVGIDCDYGDDSNGWNKAVLTRLASLGVLPDFVVQHHYAQGPGLEWDQQLLQDGTWAGDADALRQQLTQCLGPAGAGIEMLVTEANSLNTDPGKQTTSLTDGLYLADSMGQALLSSYSGLFWWDLHNGKNVDMKPGSPTSGQILGNNDDALYGWRAWGDFGVLNAQGPTPIIYPTFYVARLLRHFARGGDAMVAVTGGHPLLSAYAAKRTDGTLALLVVNKAAAPLTGNISLTGFTPTADSAVYYYGKEQDNVLNPDPAAVKASSPDVARTPFAGASAAFSYAFPAYSATLFSLTPPPALTALALVPVVTAGGVTVAGTLSLDRAAPAGGVSVSLSSSNTSAATVPAQVAVPAGASSATFPVTTHIVPGAANAAVTVSATLGAVTQTAQLTLTPTPGVTFGGGLNFLSLPFDYGGTLLDQVFGYAGVKMAFWQPALSAYALTPAAPADAVRLGRGYWVRFPQALTVAASGVPADPSTDFRLSLSPGWNQIGDPFLSAVPLTGLKVESGSSTSPFPQASGAAGLVGAGVYGYDPAQGSYFPVALNAALQPGRGYWMWAALPVTLVVPHP